MVALKPNTGIINLALGNNYNNGEKKVQVSLRNEERSWEPFYISIECDNKDEVPPLSSTNGVTEHNPIPISTINGKLAPGGGAGGFSDTCTISIHQCYNSSMEDDGTTHSNDSNCVIHYLSQQSKCYLVSRTEENAWCWPIIVST